MCKQLDKVFACGHTAFFRVDNCDRFGSGCFGPGGDHVLIYVKTICSDCEVRPRDPNPEGRQNDPYRKASQERAAAEAAAASSYASSASSASPASSSASSQPSVSSQMSPPSQLSPSSQLSQSSQSSRHSRHSRLSKRSRSSRLGPSPLSTSHGKRPEPQKLRRTPYPPPSSSFAPKSSLAPTPESPEYMEQDEDEDEDEDEEEEEDAEMWPTQFDDDDNVPWGRSP